VRGTRRRRENRVFIAGSVSFGEGHFQR